MQRTQLITAAVALLLTTNAAADTTLRVLWRKPLAAGVSGIALSNGRAYTLGSDGDADFIFALDARTGADVWRTSIGKAHTEAQRGPGSTPAVTNELVIAVGSSCHVTAVRAADGTIAWDVDLAAQFKTRFAARGCGVSPVVHAGRVLVPTGAVDGDRFVALDVATGQRVWSSDVPRSINPASVALREANGVMQILYHHAKPPGQSGMSAVNPADGSVLWQVDLESGMSDARPLPLPDGRVLLQTWKHSTMFAAQNATLTKGPSVLWSNDELSAGNAPPVFLDDHLYGFGGNSGEFLKCIDSRTGVVKWSTRPYRGTGILVGRTLVVQSESSGLLRLVAAEPAAYREIARLEVMKPGATTLTPPAHADGVVYVRNQEEVVAVAIR